MGNHLFLLLSISELNVKNTLNTPYAENAKRHSEGQIRGIVRAEIRAALNASLVTKFSSARETGGAAEPEAKTFVVTTGWIKANATPAGGYRAEQLKLIGVRYPLASGWMGTAYGRAITEADRQKFESYHHGHGATNKSKAILAAGIKVGKDSGEFGRTECKSGYLVDCDCDVLPWEDCEHSLAAASDRQAAAEMTQHNLF